MKKHGGSQLVATVGHSCVCGCDESRPSRSEASCSQESGGSLHVTVSSWHNDTWHSLILKYVRFCAAFASLRIWHAECISYGEDKNEAAKAQESKKAV